MSFGDTDRRIEQLRREVAALHEANRAIEALLAENAELRAMLGEDAPGGAGAVEMGVSAWARPKS